MADEIERKFLVAGMDWESDVIDSSEIQQGYLAVNEQCGIRVRISGANATLNIKSAGLQIARKEYEYSIPLADAREMLDTFGSAQQVRKIRHRVAHDDRVWEVDVFEGANRGLVMAEIELESERDAVVLPPWVGREVSGDARYMNNNLAVRPYQSWAED